MSLTTLTTSYTRPRMLIKPRVLIVEDEVLIADSLKRYLIKNGYEVIGTPMSYEAAAHIFLRHRPDLVLLDIRLSGQLTGIDFAHFIRENAPETPFVFLSSQLDRQTLNDAKATFPAGYLSKPIHKPSLLTTIEMATHASLPKAKAQTIAIQVGAKKVKINPKEIAFLQAEHIYVRIVLTSGNVLLSRTSMQSLLRQLPEKDFYQIHRSYAVNLQQVKQWDDQNVYFGAESIPISRSKRKQVVARLAAQKT